MFIVPHSDGADRFPQLEQTCHVKIKRGGRLGLLRLLRLEYVYDEGRQR